MATFQKRQKEAARAERRREKLQKRIEKNDESKGPQIEHHESLPELALEIGPDGRLIGLDRERKLVSE